MIKPTIIASLLLLLPSLSKGEINYSHSGYASATTVNRLSDGSIIKMPYRALTYEPVLSFNNFNIIANTALEFRLKDINQIMDSDLKVDLRELYIEWMTPLGDFSLGKQIITWGSASENNPTDNISPYNYYYLFSLGKERKEGILSLNSTLYWNNLKLNTVLIPQHNTNVLPLNDPEFAISIPINPRDEQILVINEPFEYGLSITMPIQSIDITTSYFSGYDRIMSFFGVNFWTESDGDPQNGLIDTVLSYRKTDNYGLGVSTLLGDFSLNIDYGYFISKDNIDRTFDGLINSSDADTTPSGYSTVLKNFNSHIYRDLGAHYIIDECERMNKFCEQSPNPNCYVNPNCGDEPLLFEQFILDNRAKYYQFTIEVQYAPNSDFNIISQYTNYDLISIGNPDTLFNTQDGPTALYPDSLFIPGMGSPNTFISSNAISISARKLFPDMGLELSYTSMFDLGEKGSLHAVGLEYELFSNTKLLIEVTKIFDNEEIPMNPFTGMKDFSRILFEIRYFY